MHALFDAMRRFILTGGWLMAPLLAVGLAMWTALILRALTLRPGFTGPMSELVEGAAVDEEAEGVLVQVMHRVRTQWDAATDSVWRLRAILEDERQRLMLGGKGIDAMIAVAPLLGLLGTVTGMIETFDAFGQMARQQQAAQIANGISKALVTTEIGLFLSIPGLLVSRVLNRRQERMLDALDEIEMILITRSDDDSEEAA